MGEKLYHRVPITEEQEKLSYANFYHMPIAEPDPKKLEILEAGPCDPKKALKIQDRRKIFDPGYLDVETGYCVMEDGTGFVANHTFFPGATGEMFDWWFAWHGLEDMRYTIWDPDDHYACDSQNKMQNLNPTLPMKERHWDTTHIAVEDIGFGKEKVCISFKNPSIFYPEDADKVGTEACATIITSNAGSPEREGLTTVMTHFVREVEGGVELRTRYWMGWQIINGKALRTIPLEAKVPEMGAYTLLKHNIKEFTNLADKLPLFWAQEKDNW